MSRLDELVAAVGVQVARRRERVPLAELHDRLERRPAPRPFKEALVRPGLSVIAEFKRASPSAGEIRAGADPSELAAAFERGGAAAVSVLTEEERFAGSLEDLVAARAAVELPVLRKDFVIEGYQLYEAAAAGADAVLLIAAALGDEGLETLYATADELDLDCLVEVHSEPELARTLELIDPEVIGINNRNLADLSVDVERTPEVMADVPAGKTVVAESGYETRAQLLELERIGADAVLIGETLMRAADPEEMLRILTHDEDATREHRIV